MTVRLVDCGWETEFFGALKADSSHVRIMSPFIKASVIDRLLEQEPTKLQVITRFNLSDFAEGVSDLDALRQLTEAGAQVRGIKHLHAKLYVFGSTRAVITSANLTSAGLNRNFELGMISEDVAIIRACQNYFDRLWTNAGTFQHQEIDDWDERITRYRLRGGSPNYTADLHDYGADLGIENTALTNYPTFVDPNQQAFVKFLGNSKREHREPLSTSTLAEIRSSGCHWALSYGRNKTPRSVRDGAVMFIGRFTRDPNDIRVFGRGIGMEYVEGRDDATPDDIQQRPWKNDYPRYIRVHHAEFVAGELANGVSREELMNLLGADSFASTQRNARLGNGKNTDPKRACRQQAAMELTPESHAWLEERLQEAFATYGKISQHQLDTIGWPIPI